MRILPRAQREAMFAVYAFCRAVDDIADDGGPRERAPRRARSAGAPTSTRSMPARARRRSRGARRAGRARFGLRREDFLAVIDGMEMDAAADIRAPDWATLDLYCDRVASAVGRLSVRIFGHGRRTPAARSRTISAARCSSPTSCATSTRTPRIGRLYLPREALRAGRASRRRDPRAVLADPALDAACRRGSPRGARSTSRRRTRIMARAPARGGARAAHHGARPTAACSTAWSRAAGAPPRRRACAAQVRSSSDRPAARARLMARHGPRRRRRARRPRRRGALAAPGARVVVHEAAGRPAGAAAPTTTATLGLTIDNGNHLLLSGNRAALAYLDAIGAPTTR